MKFLLLIPASLCLAYAKAKPESDYVSVLATPVVAAAEQVCDNVRGVACVEAVVDEERGNDELGVLRDHLDGMARSLRETGKSVAEMARQRDAAREDAARHQNNHAAVLREMAKLREELQAARSEGAEWKAMASSLKDQMDAGALAHAEMENFRGELQGAMKEFQAMKADFGKAREELQDPIERSALKKSVADLEISRKNLAQDLEMALQAKDGLARDVEGLQAALRETEGQVRDQVEETKKIGRSLEEARAGQAKALADVAALQQQAAAEREKQIVWSKERDELRRSLEERVQVAQAATRDAGESRMRMVALEEQQERAGKELAELDGHLQKLEAEVNGKEQALVEAVGVAQEAKGARDAMESALAEAQTGLAAREQALAGLQGEMKKLREGLKQAEAGKREASEELQGIRGGLDAARDKLVTVTKAKSGLEELLFKKTAEVRELKVALRNMQAQWSQEQRREEETPVKVATAAQG